ncbi:MAG: hypothetical protein ACREL9_05685 [Gemmatimonadales bacterium]
MPEGWRRVFRAVGTVVVPEASRLDDRGWDGLERIVDRALAARPARMRRQFGILLLLLQWLPLLRYGRSLTALDPTRRARFLAAIQDARLLLLRRGFWGLRTLILMGYYARPDASREIGYRGHRGGWAARRAAAGTE